MNVVDSLVRGGTLLPARGEEALRRHAAEASSEPLHDWLIAQGFAGEADVLRSVAQSIKLRFFPAVEGGWLDPDLVRNLPVDWARQHACLPLRIEGGVYAVVARPEEIYSADDLALLLGEELEVGLAPREAILRAIDDCYFQKRETSDSLIATMRKDGEATPVTERSDDLLRGVDQAPVIQFVNLMLLEAVRRGASDIHIEPFEKHLRIRFRVDGFLYEQSAPPKQVESALISRLKVMSRLDIAEKRLPQDGMARVRVGEREIDIRVSTVPVAEGERMVLRLLNQQNLLLPLADLGMPASVEEGFRGLLGEPSGMVLVTGPTGSGKTTTLYAALREVNTRHVNVMTIEDPIEYQLEDIGQIQVKPKIGLTFAGGLRHILRQDPDIILVGEIRDRETADIAIRAALTGHLVFSTLHTNDAVSAVVRLADMGVEPFLIASAVRAVLAQRLVRSLCPACRVERRLAEPWPVRDAGAGEPVTSAWFPVGCGECLEGYRGRTGIYELFRVDEAAGGLIRGGAAGAEALYAHHGNHAAGTLWSDAVMKVREGRTSPDEVTRILGGRPARIAP
ncbi:MAG TPA: ATPase, T2SS/T4P/T4SS family [Kiritimatiellia bacterium]|nr:ATPase, T2SS/T4P/T4SS family [Kiritimatiellia bacterium]